MGLTMALGGIPAGVHAEDPVGALANEEDVDASSDLLRFPAMALKSSPPGVSEHTAMVPGSETKTPCEAKELV